MVHSLLRRCLEKDPNRRLHEIADARIEIEDALARPVAHAPAGVAARSKRWLWLVAGVSFAAFLVSLAWIIFAPAPEAPLMRLDILAPEMQAPYFFALSPDGKRVAFVGTRADGKPQLYLRNLDALKPVPIAGTEGADFLFWSPDSHFVAFFADGKLKKVDVSGGPAQTICDAPPIHPGGTWNRDGLILFSAFDMGLRQVSDSGGTPSAVSEVDGTRHELFHNFPYFLPDGRHFLFEAVTAEYDKSSIYIGSLDSKDRSLLLQDVHSNFVYAAPGYLLFSRDGGVMGQGFDAKRLKLTGNPSRVAEDVSSFYDYASFSASDTGILAYHAGGVTDTKVQLTWYDRTGKPLEEVGAPASYLGLDLSPDGMTVAVHQHEGTSGDLWLLDSARRTNVRFTFEASKDNSSPIWSPDGSEIAYSSYRSGSWDIYRKKSDGTGNEELLFQSISPKAPMAWSPDGNNIQPFPPTGAKWQISSGGGTFPRWRGDGKELYYMSNVSGGKIMAVGVGTAGNTFQGGVPKALFESPYFNFAHSTNYHTFAVSHDGQRFLIPHPASKRVLSESLPLSIVVNWTAALRRK